MRVGCGSHFVVVCINVAKDRPIGVLNGEAPSDGLDLPWRREAAFFCFLHGKNKEGTRV